MIFSFLALCSMAGEPDFESMKAAWQKRHAERIEFEQTRMNKHIDEIVADAFAKIRAAKAKREKAIQNAGRSPNSKSTRSDIQQAKAVYIDEIESYLNTILNEKDSRDKVSRDAVNAIRNDDDPKEWREGFFGKMSKLNFRVRSVDSKDTVAAQFGDKTYILTGIDATGATPGQEIKFSGWYYVEKAKSHTLGTFLVIRAVE